MFFLNVEIKSQIYCQKLVDVNEFIMKYWIS